MTTNAVDALTDIAAAFHHWKEWRQADEVVKRLTKKIATQWTQSLSNELNMARSIERAKYRLAFVNLDRVAGFRVNTVYTTDETAYSADASETSTDVLIGDK